MHGQISAFGRCVLLAALGASACARDEPNPLASVPHVTRIEVRGTTSDGPPGPIVEPERIAAVLRAVAAFDDGWRSPWHTLPAGEVSALFLQDTTFVGVLHVGSNFLIATRPGGIERVRLASEAEVRGIRVLLGVESREATRPDV